MEPITMQRGSALGYLCPTKLLDFTTPSVRTLIESYGWKRVDSFSQRVGMVYGFVRDEIRFGCPSDSFIPASQVLEQGYGNDISKTILLMALLRAVEVPCQFHSSFIGKIIYRGLLPKRLYAKCPRSFYHGWVNIPLTKGYIQLEGHILDRKYLTNLIDMFPNTVGSFYAYGLAVLNFRNPPIKWEEGNTFVQHKAIEEDLGIFPSPDAFLTAFPDAEENCKSKFYRQKMIPAVNRTVSAIREA